MADAAAVHFAPAKLNLYLHVTARRTDGWHELDSLVAFASIGDRVRVAPAPELALTVDGPFASDLGGDVTGNLVWRAAAMLAEKLSRPPRVAIALTKNLPVASGIGGGSSDAAACLKALAALWRCSDPALIEAVAAKLGSDVPACLRARPVWLGGLGDRIEEAGRLPACGVVLVNPRVAVPTAPVYRAFRGPYTPAARFPIPADARDLASALAARRNDLMATAIDLAPAIGDVLEALAARGDSLLARMSGSGGTCFALFPRLEAAANAAAELRRDRPGWWVASAALSAEPGSAA